MNRFIAFAFFLCLSALANGNILAPRLIIPSAALTDTIPPLITCPPNDTILLPAGTCDTVVTYVVTALDDTMTIVPTQWSGFASGEPFPVGATMNVFVASDSVGNTADCSFTILVLTDTSALMCRDTFKAYLGEFCLVVPQPSELLLGTFGCSLNLLVEADKEAPFGNGPWSAAFFEETDLGKTYAYRVTDLLGSKTCTGAIRVLDTLPPELICPTVTVPCVLPPEHLNPYFLNDSLFIWEALPQYSENCSNDIDLNFVDVRADYPCDSIGTAGIVTRFWTALDASNNVSTCVQTIVRERSADAVLFPLDGTWGCSPPPLPGVTGWPFIEVNGQQYPVTDTTACGISVKYTDSEQVNCGASRLINRLWYISNGCLPDSLAVPSIGEQIVEVLEDTEPTLMCPFDTVVVINGPGCEGPVNLPDIFVADACSQVLSATAYWTINGHEDSLVAVLSNFPGNNFSNPDTLAVFGLAPSFPVGTISIFLVASDACGNTGTCEISLIVWDSLPPEARCDTFLTAFLDDLGVATLPAGLFDEGSTDECAQTNFKVRRIETGSCDTLGNPLGDFINLCCSDRGDTVEVLLRVYDVPMQPGAVPDSLAAGRYSECVAPVLVLDINNPRCTAPLDTVTTCENFDPTLAAYGTANITCVVDSVAVLTNYAQFDTVCQRGTITRTFRVFDAGGNSGQCAHKIVVQNMQHYFVRFPDDVSVVQCDTTGNSYGQPVFFGEKCEKMKVTFTETAQYGAPDACIRIERTWKIYNGCAYDSTKALVAVPNPNPNAVPTHADNLPGPVVSMPGTTGPWAPTVAKIAPNNSQPTNFGTFWSANTNGYTYKQIIRIIDLEMPVASCPATEPVFTDLSANDLFLWNANFSATPGAADQDLCEGATDLRLTVSDACYGPRVGVDYQLALDLDGNGSPETLVNSTDLPSPGAVLYNNTGGSGLAREYDKRPVNQNDKYQFALRADTVGHDLVVRLVWESAASPTTDVPMQLPLGDHSIQWTVYDGCGNETTCAYAFRVEDPDGTCSPTALTVSGHIRTETGAGIANVAVEISGTHPSLPPFTNFALTDGQGAYAFDVSAGATYTISPFHDINPLNGVSTFDLLLINKHVLGIEAIPSPYRTLAADANKSNTVTTFDIVEFRKLILGIYSQLPNLPSWRFLPSGHVFSNPANPFSGGFSEKITVNDAPPGPTVHDFIGFKLGDVNGNANPSFSNQNTDDRSDRTVLTIEVNDRTVARGEVFDLFFRAEKSVAGMQFSLNFPGLEVLEVLPGEGLDKEHFAIFNAESSLAMSWERGGVAAFGLRFRAQQAGRVRNMLRLSDRIAHSEAYTETLESLALALRFGSDGAEEPVGFELFQNQPNPFAESTRIGFYLPQAKKATLRIWDTTGRLLWEKTQACPAGKNTVLADGLGSGRGMLFYSVETDTDRAVGRMVRW